MTVWFTPRWRLRTGPPPLSARYRNTTLGMLERHDGLYANTPETDAFLDRAKPTYIGPYLEMVNARLYPFWGALTEALRSGQPQN
jgi:hypothetical protein